MTQPLDYLELRREIGQRIRTLRIHHGLTQKVASANASCTMQTWGRWEHGIRAPVFWRAPLIARGIGVPVAQLFTDELVLADVTVSKETLARVRKEGQPAADEVAARLAAALSALLVAAAERPRVTAPKGSRPKKRRTRAEVFADVAARSARARQKPAGDRID